MRISLLIKMALRNLRTGATLLTVVAGFIVGILLYNLVNIKGVNNDLRSVMSSDDVRNIGRPMMNGCVKKVHIFASEDEMKHIPEVGKYYKLFQTSTKPQREAELDCTSDGYDCDIELTMGVDVDMIRGKDAVVFGLVATQFRNGANGLLNKVLDIVPEANQTWVYYSTETPLRVVRWTADLNIGQLKYHVLMTYDRDSEIELPFGVYQPFDKPRDDDAELPKLLGMKKRLMSWMASNCKAFWPRAHVVNHLMNKIAFDTYGTCGKLECLPKRSDKCNNLNAEYKFYFAVPNSECRDYVTEKFWIMSLKYGTVPVVMGPRKEVYKRIGPPNSFIHAADFESVDKLAEYLNQLNEDDTEYRKYYDWRKKGEVVITYPYQPEVFCRLMPHMNVERKQGDFKYLQDSPWYRGCRTIPDKSVIRPTLDIRRDFSSWSVWR